MLFGMVNKDGVSGLLGRFLVQRPAASILTRELFGLFQPAFFAVGYRAVSASFARLVSA